MFPLAKRAQTDEMVVEADVTRLLAHHNWGRELNRNERLVG
jgi:hypothetical protein